MQILHMHELKINKTTPIKGIEIISVLTIRLASNALLAEHFRLIKLQKYWFRVI